MSCEPIRVKTWVAILIIVVAALLPRVLFIARFGFPTAQLDAHEYKVMAENILAGRDLNHTPDGLPDYPIRVPLYGILAAGIMRLCGNSEGPVVAAHIVISSLLCIFVFLLGVKFLDPLGALIGAVLLAFHLPSIVHCGVLYADTFFALCLAFCFFSALRLSEDKTARWAALTGVSIGLTTLCKAAGQGLVIVAILLLVLVNRPPWRRLAALSGIMIGAFIIVMSPWVIRNYNRFGAFVPTGTLAGFNFLTGNYEMLVPPKGLLRPALPIDMLQKSLKMSWAERDAYFRDEGFRMFWRNLSDLPRRAFLKTGIIFIDYPRLSLLTNIAYDSMIGPRGVRVITWTGVAQNSLYVLLAVMALLLCRKAPRRLVVLTLILMLYFWTGYVLTRSLSRYSIPLYPYICLFAGCTLSALIGRIWERMRAVSSASSGNLGRDSQPSRGSSIEKSQL
ncbi:glycosyltransferase family 39 protein [bacterium]|nr:glycosyltransferase family 39 protein [bacterium]